MNPKFDYDNLNLQFYTILSKELLNNDNNKHYIDIKNNIKKIDLKNRFLFKIHEFFFFRN